MYVKKLAIFFSIASAAYNNNLGQLKSLRSLQLMYCFSLLVLPDCIGLLRCNVDADAKIEALILKSRHNWQSRYFKPVYMPLCSNHVQTRIWTTMLCHERVRGPLPNELWIHIFSFILPFSKINTIFF